MVREVGDITQFGFKKNEGTTKHVGAVRDCLQMSLTRMMTWFVISQKSEIMVFSRKNVNP
jgi:hypothetical protein